jgi:hypothetical protein
VSTATVITPRGPRAFRGIVEAVVVCAFALSSSLLACGICMLLLTGNSLTHHDAMSFWSAGWQLAHGLNPYDADATLRLQRAAGLAHNYAPLIMRNPPFALPLVLPLGYFHQFSATLLWSACLLATLAASIRLLSKSLGASGVARWLPFTFAPALICILVGQSAIFPLLGLAIFFRYHRTHPFSAGAGLWFCLLKPHLLLPFGAILLLWTIYERRFRILAGAAAALAATCVAAWALDPHAWSQYRQMASQSGIDREFIPCLSVALRFLIRPQAMWLEWLPAACGAAFAAWYYWRRRASWDWLRDGSLILLLSLVVAPYAWVSDTALALPALIYAGIRSSRAMLVILAALMVLLEVQALAGVPWHSPLYVWPAAAWLALWLVRDPVAAHCAGNDVSRSHDDAEFIRD